MVSKPTPLASKLRRDQKSSKTKYILLAIASLVVLLLVAFSGQFVKRGMHALVAKNSSWTCGTIQIHPGVEIPTDSILVLSACSSGERLGEYSTATIEQRLERHPWIQDAVVVRHPPDVLKITITERVCVGILRDSPDFGVSEDLYILPCSDKPWVNKLPWISVNAPFVRQLGALTSNDPLLPVATELTRVRQISIALANNIAELYRVDGHWGAVLMNPVLSVTIGPGLPAENWIALDQLLSDEQFQDRLDSNSIVDLRLPGFVTLQVPPQRAEESKSS
ncbi:MAG: FtsQ-type POTRA domain-containing protein [bacterium]|nr:FtsQ-type POTRA domain-containing protein [bacterium]